jgi:sterile alpha motif and leucine zipper-containing kinase AZK
MKGLLTLLKLTLTGLFLALLSFLFDFTLLNIYRRKKTFLWEFCSAEYIVDLMGAPGTLIPSEISVSQFQDSNNSQLSSDAIEESVAELCIALEQVSGVYESKNDMGGSSSDLALTTPRLEDGGISQQMEVNETSKYLAPEGVDSQFAQNLHDLLLESGALLPTGLLSDKNSRNSSSTTEMSKTTSPDGKETAGWLLVAQTSQNSPKDSVAGDCLPKLPFPSYEDVPHPVENTEATIRNLDADISTEGGKVADDSLVNVSGSSSVTMDKLSCSSTKTISSVMDDVAEYEISWEDLEIGDRIGLGMCIYF